MPTSEIEFPRLKANGTGTCAGGKHPDPPLDYYPLLAWTERHPRFGEMVVHLCDQSASVHDIAVAFAETPSYEAVAARFGTSPVFVEQAVRYATACGFLG